jgi:hypothetical protein
VTIRLAAGAAEQIAAHHDAAAGTVQDSAGSMPGAPDAGLGAPEITAIMAALVDRANTLGGLNELVAAQLRDIGANYARTEDEVAGMFANMTKELE